MSYYLGIDPGLSEIGFGVIQVVAGQAEYADCGIIKTLPSDTFSGRLKIIKDGMREILHLYKYEAVGVEELFFVKNITNGIKVSHARGVILAEIEECGYPLYEFKPKEVKVNVTGYGSAEKAQVQEAIRLQLHLTKVPQPHDAADALAAAISAFHSHKAARRLKC